MANEQNLIPASDPRGHKLTAEELSKGGKRSGEARKAKRTFRELMEEYGKMQSKEHPELTNDEAVIFAQYQKAKNEKAMGSTEAAKFIRDTKGEKPVEQHQIETIEPPTPLYDARKKK